MLWERVVDILSAVVQEGLSEKMTVVGWQMPSPEVSGSSPKSDDVKCYLIWQSRCRCD